MELCYPTSANWGSFVFPENPTPAEIERKELAEAFAWTTLQTLTAFQIALCPITVRPTSKRCWDTYRYGSGYDPHMNSDGKWVNVSCGHWNDCSCTTIKEVILDGQVGAIVSVMIDGFMVEPENYRIDNGNRLVRQDGVDWPLCQDMNIPAGEVGSFVVTYYQGTAPNTLINYAAGSLAAEFYRAMLGDKKCRLPNGVRSVTRQGISFEIQDDLFSSGFTGIQEVDIIIRQMNPYQHKSEPVIMSIDTLPQRRTTIGAIPSGFMPGYGTRGYGR